MSGPNLAAALEPRRDWGGEPIMVPREQVVAVCEGLLSSFPEAESNPPVVLEDYFDSGSDVAIITNKSIQPEDLRGGLRAVRSLDDRRGPRGNGLRSAAERIQAASVGMCSRSRLVGPATCGNPGEWYLLTWPT